MAAPAPSTRFNFLLNPRKQLVDADGGGQITANTKLAAFHVPADGSSDEALFRNFMSIVEPAEPCTLILENEIEFPPTQDVDDYRLAVTLKELWVAPVIRLECKIKGSSSTAKQPILHLALEFHLTKHSRNSSAIRDFKIEKEVVHGDATADEMTFTSQGAACEGFNWISRYEEQLGPRSTELTKALLKIVKAGNPQKIRLRFNKTFCEGKSVVASLVCHLPGGTGPLLPSLEYPGWSMYLTNGVVDNQEIYHPWQLVNAKVPHPLVPSKSYLTFSSLDAASRELRYSAYLAALQQELSLKLWAETTHTGSIYRVGAVAVIAVRFDRDFEKLESANGPQKFSLPDGLYTEMDWSHNGRTWKCAGRLTHAPIRLPENDAVFTITSHQAKAFEQMFLPPKRENTRWVDIEFDPHMNKFTLSGQLETAKRIVCSSTSRWHPLILNQLYTDLEIVDLITGNILKSQPEVLEGEVEKAYRWVLHYRKWNKEQLEALRSIRKALGGVVLISGPAGCGKTLVQQAISVFLYRIGLHILVVAPANSNCGDYMRKLSKAFPNVNALRIFPASTELELRDVDEDQAKLDKPGHVGRASANFIDFNMMLDAALLLDAVNSEDKYKELRKFGVQAQVLKTALDGNWKLPGYLKDAQGRRSETQVDLWTVLRDSIENCRAKKFDWNDKASVAKYEQSYKACKGHFIANSRFIVTTTGNVRCSEITDYWAQDLYKTKCTGIVIVLDEACKDREIDTLTVLLSREFQSKIRGMIMLGDERQLEPTNRSSKGNKIFSPFPERESISMLSRLKNQGFECIELKEQHRMNQHISYWPFKNFYPEGMRNAPEMCATLEKKQPGLRACLLQFFCDHYDKSDLVLKDERLRTHYIEINGQRRKKQGSSVVYEHVQIFFNNIFWYLHAYYGKDMAENVMIITSYRESKRLWKEVAAFIQRKYNFSDKDMPCLGYLPEILTVDSSQGQEAPVVILDCCIQGAASLRGDIGFVDDDGRMNVAFTRAQEVLFILGGDCAGASGETSRPAYVRYRKWLQEQGRLTRMRNTEIAGVGSGWIDKLEKKEVMLSTTFADDMPKRKKRESGNAKETHVSQTEQHAQQSRSS